MAKPTTEDARLVVEFAKLAAESGITDAADWIWSDDFSPNYDDFVKKYPRGTKEHARASKICGFYETIGALWKHGLFSQELIFEWLWVSGVWDRLKSFALAQRKASGEEAIYELFEAMAEEQKKATAKVPVGASAR
jgi:hypothetical protein